MLVYLTIVFKVPITVCNKIDHICQKFLWAKSDSGKSYSLVAQRDFCTNKMKGGLGLKKMKQVSLALKGEIVWKIANGTQKEWTQTIK